MISAESNSANRNIRARFTLLIALVVLAAGCSPKSSPKLIVGMELAYPPFEMTDPQGRPTGVSVDLARALGKFLGLEIQIQNLPFDGLIPSLQTRKLDLIISSLTATPERAKSIDFARSGVAVSEEMIRSSLRVWSDGIRPSNGRFWIWISRPRNFPSARARSTLTPVGRPCGSVISNGG